MIKIITDTTACVNPLVIHKYQIPVIPQVINFGEESYYEGEQIDIFTFMQRLKSADQLPKTAAPPPELFVKEFQRIAPTGESILCIHPSAEVSGTVRSAIVAARDFPELDIHIIDTRTIAGPLGSMVQAAAEWSEQGLDIHTIEGLLQSMIKRSRIYFLVATLEYLARGGRIGGAAALIGSVLQIKPILTINDGRVEVYEKERTFRRALQRLKEIVISQAPHNPQAQLSVLHADAEAEALVLAHELSQLLDQADVPVFHVPPAIVTHGGPGVLGVGFFVSE